MGIQKLIKMIDIKYKFIKIVCLKGGENGEKKYQLIIFYFNFSFFIPFLYFFCSHSSNGGSGSNDWELIIDWYGRVEFRKVWHFYLQTGTEIKGELKVYNYSINFFVLDEANYERFINHFPFSAIVKYTNIKEASFWFTANHDDHYYFILDTGLSNVGRSVELKVYKMSPR